MPIMSKEKRVRRTNDQLKSDIMGALEQLIIKRGFTNVNMFALTQEAKISPQVFYEHCGTMDKLFEELAGKYDFWLNGVLNLSELSNLSPREFFAKMLKVLYTRLEEEPIMQKLLIWELSESNPVTRKTAGMRDIMTTSLLAYYEGIFKSSGIDIKNVIAILFAGVYYLVLHRECSTFCSVNFNTDEGREAFFDAIDTLTNAIFDKIERQQRLQAMIRQMQNDKIPLEKISIYLNLSVQQIKKIVALDKIPKKNK